MRGTERGWAVDGCGTTRGLFRGILRLGFGLRVTGEEQVPTHSPVILAANRGSQIDPIVPAAAMPRRCTFLAAAELLTMPVLGTLVRPFNLVPLKRGEIDRRALKHCLDRLECGEARAIFPEGKISGDGRPQPARDGLGFIAYHARVPIVPVGITGTYEVWPLGTRRPRRERITVQIGDAIEPEGVPTREHESALTARLMAAISRLSGSAVGSSAPFSTAACPDARERICLPSAAD